MSKFRYGKGSRRKLYGHDGKPGVHPDVAALCESALSYSSVDFSITDAVRSKVEQRTHFDAGNSELDGVNKIGDHQRALAIDFLPVAIYKDGERLNMYDVRIPEVRFVWLECYHAFLRAGMKTGLVLEFGFGYVFGSDPEARDWPHISIKGRVPKDYSGMSLTPDEMS